jgi:hypothetical protein
MKIITLSDSKFDYLLEGLRKGIESEDIIEMILNNTNDPNDPETDPEQRKLNLIRY